MGHVVRVVADFTHLRSPPRAGHSRAVAGLAATAGRLCGLPMAGKAVINLSAGLEDPEKVTVAFLVAVGCGGVRPPDADVPG